MGGCLNLFNLNPCYHLDMKLLTTLNNDNVTEEESKDYKYRQAVRGIAMNNEGNIALNYSRKYKYYALPGGGVEKDESLENAFIRECKEEIGCIVEILKEVGITKEFMKNKSLINEEFCYVVKVIEDNKGLSLEEDEAEEDLVVEWMDVDKAIHLITTVNSLPSLRDVAFLEEYKNQI
jgi:8-oxo-dGTP diphosphatase